jgi:prolyl-tRNA synthetase
MNQQKIINNNNSDKKNLLGLTNKKEENFSEWYSELVVKSELIEYSEISGCYVLRPWAYSIWEIIQSHLNIQFKKLDISNAYFPMFVTEKTLSKEQEHLEGFTPEVAWVTHSGDTKLDNKLAIRPTSETIIYPYFSKWIRTHRDLPLKINQWCNVVRWEFKDPTPFIRSREFLWHEAHTTHESYEETKKFVQDSLEVYYRTYKDFLAIPTIKGVKTDTEKFAGADYTTTIEAYIQESGKGIQAATSHNLGQNFAKMFGIEFEGKDMKKHIPYQTSFGFTTRSIGIMIMTHSDNKGLVLPPKVSPIQIVIVPIYSKKYDDKIIDDYSNIIYSSLKDIFRVKLDNDKTNTAGFKFNHWELKGVPLRIEIGGQEAESKKITLFRRDMLEKETISGDDYSLEELISNKLNQIQSDMYIKSDDKLNTNISECLCLDEFIEDIKQGKLVMTPFCDDSTVEEEVKTKCKELYGIPGVKTLCKPYLDDDGSNINSSKTNTKCFASSNPATCWVLWGKSY